MVHATALVDPGAELAEDVEVGPFAIIGAKVRIGRGTRVGPHAVIRGPTEIGCGNRIFQFASVGEDPQDMKYGGEPTLLTLGDRNVIRECATIHRGTVQDRGVTAIGSDNLLMAYIHVAHDCRIGDHVILANAASLGGHVEVQDWAILGGFTIVHQFCRIGAHSFSGMGSSISQDLPPFVMAAGHPAVPTGINSEGLRRRGFDPATIGHIKRAYRLLYRSGLYRAPALKAMREIGCAPVEQMADFVAASRRGILR